MKEEITATENGLWEKEGIAFLFQRSKIKALLHMSNFI